MKLTVGFAVLYNPEAVYPDELNTELSARDDGVSEGFWECEQGNANLIGSQGLEFSFCRRRAPPAVAEGRVLHTATCTVH